ncbi:hypothetical protein AB0K60_19220 [Thermopolyspora sp. NPDC052614]|uniref:hypothetical protein n=1 Tax=Thermopolyspora sp. NPDC052614 TaxID=3155682 RepID=UPI00341C02A9
MTDRMFARLRPDELDELAEVSYQRRRREDLARAFHSTRHPTSKRSFSVARRPIFLLATGAVAAVAAGAVVLSTGVLSGAPARNNPPVAAGSPSTASSAAGGAGASPAPTRIDARSFLLAAADTALREPTASGEYWYVRERSMDRVFVWPKDARYKEFWAELSKLQKQEAAEVEKIDVNSDRLVEINEKYNKKLDELRERIYPGPFPYEAYRVQVTERWRPKRAGGTNREKSKDLDVVFASPEDEVKWKELGSPKLLKDGVRTDDDNLPQPLSIQNMNITMQNVGKLPTSKKALADRLRTQFESLPNPDKDFALYLWQTTVDLMTAPTTPGTRAALFRILADQPGIVSNGEVKDATGREGVGLSLKDPDGNDFGLIINPDTAELLGYSVRTKDAAHRVAYEEFGWTDRLGQRPQG